MEDTSILRRLAAGTAAGAAGAAALNTVTYLDMLLRGRAASRVPTKDVQRLEDLAGVDDPASEDAQQTRSHRETAAGALVGYGVGLGVGVAAAAAWPVLRRVPLPLSAALVGATAMAGSDVPSVALGVTDPRSWSRASWVADILPHLAYGLVTVALARELLARD